ncbi:LEA type 2 family protein [Gilvimarinus algae]|uniref:LEA type 2 family protein n=1 Tax=Gilvimarinus algae TaxID=3058037 RepID=A0ABT8TA95_9GAMM|nr:LEA type 2 family protein [Gilvimarinus sp. SDUM040014]MDO3381050.1 LEA type 2 family protein [Gilvimarinus sp. SDUM040014]
MLSRLFAGLLSLVLLSVLGCASLQPGFSKPEVTVTGLRLLPPLDGEFAPRLGVTLRVLNPGSVDLSADGMSYSIALDGFDLLTGVRSGLPVFAAYSETPLELVLTADVLQMLRLGRALAERPDWRPVEYEFKARIDTGRFSPAIEVREQGEVSFEDMAASPRLQ